MATIEEELAIAKKAKAAIRRKSRTETIEVLRRANGMVAEQKTTFASEGHLNDARHKLGLVLPLAIRALEDQASEERIEKAKSAIDAWIKELEAAKP
jgi:hypothetical protein